jgi:hypothetical protein
VFSPNSVYPYSTALNLPIYEGTTTNSADPLRASNQVTGYGPYPAVDVNYYHNLKDINVKFQDKVSGSYTGTVAIGDNVYLHINEMPVSIADIPMCEGEDVGTGGDSIAQIHVVDLPSLAWDPSWKHEVAGCVTNDSMTLATQISGYGPWVISYEIQKLKKDGSNDGSAVRDSSVVGKTGDTAYGYMYLPSSQFAGIGGYTVKILNVTDRFSRKSLDYLWGHVPNGTPGVNKDENDPQFKVTVIPTPRTKTLKHVKNKK